MKNQAIALSMLIALAVPAVSLADKSSLISSTVANEFEGLLWGHVAPVHLMERSALVEYQAFEHKVAVMKETRADGKTFFAAEPDEVGRVTAFAETSVTPDGLYGGTIQFSTSRPDGSYVRGAMTIPAVHEEAPSAISVTSRRTERSVVLERTFRGFGSGEEHVLNQKLEVVEFGGRTFTLTRYSRLKIGTHMKYVTQLDMADPKAVHIVVGSDLNHAFEGRLDLPLDGDEMVLQATAYPSGPGARVNVKTSKGFEYTYLVDVDRSSEGRLKFKQISKTKLADGIDGMLADMKKYSPRAVTPEPVIRAHTSGAAVVK